MRYPASEKLEIIQLVERSHLPIKQTLDKLGVPRTTFYRWYDRYQISGPEALEDQSPRPSRVWNRIPDDVRQRIVDLALDVPGSIFTRAFRAAGITSRIMSETLGYSAAEIAAVDPKDATMMELGLQLVDDEPEVQSIMEQAFAANEDESDFLKRIKNSPRKIVEGGVTGIIAERSFQALGMAYRALRNSPKFKQVQAQSVEDALAEPPASKGLFGSLFAR